MSELRALRERVEKADGPSTEIDRMIFAFDFGWSYPLVGAAWEEWLDQGSRYTASIDAAVALIERKLPGWTRYLNEERADRWTAGVKHPQAFLVVEPGQGGPGDGSYWKGPTGWGIQRPTPALALIAALLNALETHNG